MTLMQEIDRYFDNARESNPLYVGAKQGILNRRHVASYVSNLRVLFQASTDLAARAERVARNSQMPELAEFFSNKVREETGHSAWAEDDLRALQASAQPACSAVTSMIDFLAESIDQNPVHFMAYILFAEYFTLLAGPEFLRNLEDRCGIPMGQVSAVGKHIEADKQHVEDDLLEISRIISISGSDHEAGMMAVLERSKSFLEDFSKSIAEGHA